MVDILPLVVAAIPFGVLYGALAQTNGMSIAFTMAMSLFVFAGSSQFIAVTLLAVHASPLVIIVTTLVVNLRHFLYALSLIPFVKNITQGRRALMAFWLTDESFAVTSLWLNTQIETSTVDQNQLQSYYFGAAILMYVNWNICTVIGIYLGDRIPELSNYGLEIAMVVAFIGIVVPLLINLPMWACAFTGAIVGLLTWDWPQKIGLIIAALTAIAVGVILEMCLSKKPDRGQTAKIDDRVGS